MLDVDLVFIRVNQRLLLALVRLISSRRRSWVRARAQPKTTRRELRLNHGWAWPGWAGRRANWVMPLRLLPSGGASRSSRGRVRKW